MNGNCGHTHATTRLSTEHGEESEGRSTAVLALGQVIQEVGGLRVLD